MTDELTTTKMSCHETMVFFGSTTGFDLKGCNLPEGIARRIVQCWNVCTGMEDKDFADFFSTDLEKPLLSVLARASSGLAFVDSEKQRALDALAVMYAKDFPFAPLHEGGMGLAYISENLTVDAWAARQNIAHMDARAVLERHKRIPYYPPADDSEGGAL